MKVGRYVVIELRKVNVNDEFYERKEYVCKMNREAVSLADKLARLAQKDLEDGKIVDFQIEY